MTPSLPTTGPGDEPKRCCRSTSPPDSSTEPRTYAARSATAPCSPTRTDPAPHANGSTGWPPLARRSSRLGHSQPGHRFTPSHPPPLQPHPPATRACSSRMPGDWHVRFLGGPGVARRWAYVSVHAVGCRLGGRCICPRSGARTQSGGAGGPDTPERRAAPAAALQVLDRPLPNLPPPHRRRPIDTRPGLPRRVRPNKALIGIRWASVVEPALLLLGA
jgi:hypothetical protein